MTYKFIARVAAVLWALTGSVAQAEIEYTIGLPERYHGDADKLWESFLDFVLHGAAKGDRVLIFNAPKRELIAELKIPDQPGFDNPNRRKRQLHSDLLNLGRFMKKHYVDERVDSDAVEQTEQLRIPQFLEAISTVRSADWNNLDRHCVLMVGSALYHDAREPQFNMLQEIDGSRQGFTPSDGMILRASQTQSIYGTADKAGLLERYNIHLVHTDKGFLSDVFKQRAHRAWHIFAQVQGGVLATFSDDLDRGFERFVNCVDQPGRDYGLDTSRNVIAMQSITRVGTASGEVSGPREEPLTAVQLANDDWLSNRFVVASQSAPIVESGALKIGIRWGDSGQCQDSDMDLYVRASADHSFLYYGNKGSPDGVYHKDHQSSPGTTNGLEYSEITRRVNLRDLEILVNHYSGSCRGGVEGVVRAYFNSSVYELAFRTNSDSGNGGRARGDAASSDHWIVVKPKDLFNLAGS